MSGTAADLFTNPSITGIIAAITAIGALGTAASGLVDATKAFGGGVSNVGFERIKKALHPFRAALGEAEHDWTAAIRASWINGMSKDDQKAAAKSLIRLGLSSKNAASMAAAGHVDADALVATITAVEQGAPLSPAQVNILGRFNAAIDAAMDGGFERADQEYRNAAKLCAGIAAVLLAIAAGLLLKMDLAEAALVGVIAVPLAPVAKDLTSSLQAAVTAMKAVKG